MSKKADENITAYIQPIMKSKTVYDLLEEYKYMINMLNTEGEPVQADVVNVKDVLSIIVTTQLESSVILIEKMLTDEKIVMIDHLKDSFEKYTNDLRKVINDPETFIKNENK
jgi:hypothetical protein